MDIVKVTMGLLLTLAGSQIHWYFAAVAGFVVGEYLARQSLIPQSEWSLLFNSLKYSVLNIVLAVVLKPLAAILSALAFGAYIWLRMPAIMGWDASLSSWPIVAVVGIIAAIFTMLSYTFAIILLSSVAGAFLVAHSAAFRQFDQGLLVLFLIFIGVTCQFIMLRYAEPSLE